MAVRTIYINSYGFTQFVQSPTRDKHILDLVLFFGFSGKRS